MYSSFYLIYLQEMCELNFIGVMLRIGMGCIHLGLLMSKTLNSR